jgi:hypothetical protein
MRVSFLSIYPASRPLQFWRPRATMFSLAFSAEGILASSIGLRAYPRPSSIHVVALADGVGPESWLEDVSDADDAALDAFLSELSDDPPAPVRYASLVDREAQERPIRPRPGTSADRLSRSSRKPPPRQKGMPNGRRRQLAMPVAPQSGVPRPVYDAPDGDGIERSSFGGQLTVLVPTKVMAFIDGSWLYYTLFERGRRCPIVQRYGAGWYHSHHVDWTAITQLISDHISAELLRMQPYNERAIEVVRVLVYSSFREDQQIGTEREKMFRALQELNYEVHLGSFTGGQEKCVDISLAVDMLHYATLPQGVG